MYVYHFVSNFFLFREAVTVPDVDRKSVITKLPWFESRHLLKISGKRQAKQIIHTNP
jgi:hypothetical protein